MGLLSKFGYHVTYKEPERLTADEARQRRFFSELTRQRKALEGRAERLSQANQFHLKKLKEFESKFQSVLEARAREVRFAKTERAKKFAMLGLFQLKQQRAALLQRADAERRRNYSRSQAAAANRNYYSPYLLNPRSVSGTEARTYVSATARRLFKNPLSAFPCIQRVVRREVIFAKGHGHKGHRGRRRFNPLSNIGC